MKLYVVRHGQTNWNVENKLQGCVDIPLNDTGIKQADILAKTVESLDFDLIISSPLSRALDTAKIINKNLNVDLITNDALLERNFDCLEGVYGSDYDKYLFWDYNLNYEYKGVEPIQSFFRRVYNFIDILKENYSKKNLLLVTHNGVNIAINCYFNGIPNQAKSLLDIKLDNCTYVEYNL